MDEFVCLTVFSGQNEPADNFNKRLIAFWSDFLRTFPEQYRRVCAEAAHVETMASRFARKYLAGVDTIDVLEPALAAAQLDHEPIDRDDLYSKYEASSPEWFLIPH